MRAALITVGAVAIVAAGCGGDSEKATALADPPRIVPWSAIGDAAIGFPVDRVRESYGSPIATRRLHLPVGTLYARRAVIEDTYRVRGGKLVVTYVDGVTKAIETTSSRYRSRAGIGVGVRVSRGRCHRNTYGSCEYRWRAFSFDECGGAWVRVSRPLEIEIGMTRDLRTHDAGRIAWIRFGDLQVVLHCF